MGNAKQIEGHQRKKYLESRGGRDDFDVEEDAKGEFIWMTDGYKMVKIYLPFIK